MSQFRVKDYLTNKFGEKGYCRSCNRVVSWARAKVLSHKRTNCANATVDERQYFSSLRQSNVVSIAQTESPIARSTSNARPTNTNSSPQQNIVRFMDHMTEGNRSLITQRLASFFFRTGLSFRAVESAALKDLMEALRPAYTDCIPSVKTLRTNLLLLQYEDLFARGQLFLANSTYYSLVTDGWSNVRGEHIINFVVITHDNPPFFYRSFSTVGISQTSEEIARVILEVIDELGLEKCVSIVSDNASNMRGAWDIIEGTHPIIFANGCGAHVMNLVVKDICTLAEFAEVLKKVQQVVRFIKDHQHISARFQRYRREFSISR